MKKLISCTFNMDTACVELKFSDGSIIAIDTIAVENEAADNMVQRSELDWLIYSFHINLCRQETSVMALYLRNKEHIKVRTACDRSVQALYKVDFPKCI